MNKNVLKTIKVIIIVFIVATLIFSIVVSQDEHHLEKCHKDECIYCAIIHIAQNIMILSISVVIDIMLGILIYYFLSRLCKEKEFYEQFSLVFQKVQLNE